METTTSKSTYHGRQDRRRSVRNSWHHLVQRWAIHRIPPARQIILNHQNIFILPNRQSVFFLVILGLMMVAAINYEVRLAFALVFLLLGMFLLSILYTYRNLSGLEVSASPGTSVFAGEKAEVSIVLNRRFKRCHEAVQIGFDNSPQLIADLIDIQEQRLSVFVNTYKRGHFSPGRLTIETIFPFGICRAWSLLNLDFECLVYPKPIATDIDWFNSDEEIDGINRLINGNDDFYGMREYKHGDSLQHVSWKNLAAGQGMLTKQYSTAVEETIWLHWDLFPGMPVEDRLSRLCYCVLKLDASDLDYGLNLPGCKIDPAKGSVHFAKTLEALALYVHEGES